MDALLPSLYHGIPLLGYRGRFDPEKSFWLMQSTACATPSSFRLRSR